MKQKEVKQTIATVPDLSPSTLYCVKVQAFSEPYNKSSAFSQQECIHTPAGGHSLALLPPLELELLPLHCELLVGQRASIPSPASWEGARNRWIPRFQGCFILVNRLSPSGNESPVLQREEIKQIC